MGKALDHLTPELQAFALRQHVFFVATAPLKGGHVNLSPKGRDAFRVLTPERVAYLDLTGSGNETSAHLLENGRITLMFCAFEGPPLILRLYGQGRTILKGTGEYDSLAPLFPDLPGARQIITVDLALVRTSCGDGVPFMDFRSERDKILQWAESKGEAGLEAYRQEKNRRSIDGLPTALGRE
ncbi:MAG: pyridoxamine 5'-phosphate oxidase family protein [Acidobacteriota bacterium]|nr:pyridoxamine 5'-phosphate oxidase family protein [Acidobacteriota bacterium]